VLVALVLLGLVVWLVFIVIGFAVKTLLWLGIVGIVLFIVTAGFGVGKLLTKSDT
jgi:hypothetical protein